MRLLQLRIFIFWSHFSETTQIIQKDLTLFFRPFFGAQKSSKPTTFEGTLTSATMVFATVSPLMMVCTWTTAIFKGHGNQPTNQGFGQIPTKSCYEKQNDTPHLKSLLLSDSILHSFNYSVSFPSSSFPPHSFSFFFLKNRAPTFLLLPAFGFLLIPIISGAFPLEPSMNLNFC